MNNAIISSYMIRAYGKYLNHFPVRDKQEETTSFYDVVTEKSESVVWQYAKKHPGEAAHVKSQVQAGMDVRRRNRVENVSTENMTMDEYKSFITMLLNSIPFDSTRIYDEEIISISEKGWEQMKNDTDYEAWVLGYTVENRSVRNPFLDCQGHQEVFMWKSLEHLLKNMWGRALAELVQAAILKVQRMKNHGGINAVRG